MGQVAAGGQEATAEGEGGTAGQGHKRGAGPWGSAVAFLSGLSRRRSHRQHLVGYGDGRVFIWGGSLTARGGAGSNPSPLSFYRRESRF